VLFLLNQHVLDGSLGNVNIADVLIAIFEHLETALGVSAAYIEDRSILGDFCFFEVGT
jgi:hypothetical protein